MVIADSCENGSGMGGCSDLLPSPSTTSCEGGLMALPTLLIAPVQSIIQATMTPSPITSYLAYISITNHLNP